MRHPSTEIKYRVENKNCLPTGRTKVTNLGIISRAITCDSTYTIYIYIYIYTHTHILELQNITHRSGKALKWQYVLILISLQLPTICLLL